MSEFAPGSSRFYLLTWRIFPDGGQTPVEDQSAREQVTFTLAIVKAGVISNRAESSEIRAALRIMFPGIAVILVAEDDELATYRGRRDLSDFTKAAACKVIPSSRISAN